MHLASTLFRRWYLVTCSHNACPRSFEDGIASFRVLGVGVSAFHSLAFLRGLMAAWVFGLRLHRGICVCRRLYPQRRSQILGLARFDREDLAILGHHCCCCLWLLSLGFFRVSSSIPNVSCAKGDAWDHHAYVRSTHLCPPLPSRRIRRVLPRGGLNASTIDQEEQRPLRTTIRDGNWQHLLPPT